MRARSLVVALGLVTLLTGEAAAQRRPRSGVWAEYGFGTGTARIGCAGCSDVTVAYGRTSYLRIGAAIAPNVLLGVEVFAFNDRSLAIGGAGSPPVEAESASITPIAVWYPGSSGLFLKGGLGIGRGTFTVTPPAGQPVTTTGTGTGLQAGIGMDLPVARWLAITAGLSAYVSAIGDVAAPGIAIDDVIATTYHAGIGLTIR